MIYVNGVRAVTEARTRSPPDLIYALLDGTSSAPARKKYRLSSCTVVPVETYPRPTTASVGKRLRDSRHQLLLCPGRGDRRLRARRRWRECRLDVVENRFQNDVVCGCNAVSPDRLVVAEGLALDRVADEGAAWDAPELEPMLALQL